MHAAVPEASLSALYQLLAEQALLAMGVPHPMLKEQPSANPQVARFFVDLLALVQEKTEGRRSPAESKELEDLLYQLRMRALDLNAASPKPGTQGA
jgi:Domain of unknown function (DUF1844)